MVLLEELLGLGLDIEEVEEEKVLGSALRYEGYGEGLLLECLESTGEKELVPTLLALGFLLLESPLTPTLLALLVRLALFTSSVLFLGVPPTKLLSKRVPPLTLLVSRFTLVRFSLLVVLVPREDDLLVVLIDEKPIKVVGASLAAKLPLLVRLPGLVLILFCSLR